MSKRTIKLYLEDIRASIKHIEQYTRGMSFEKFVKDTKTIDAVVRNIEIIGEAVKYIPSTLRVKHPSIPWKKISGARNAMIHEYFGIDETILWQTIQEDIPRLKKELQTIS